MPTTAIFYATRSGGSTLDAGDGGGNPFASALIEAAGTPRLELRKLPGRLRDLTRALSGGYQVPQHAGRIGLGGWSFDSNPGVSAERREALVLVVSEYESLGAGLSLDGAARDERRIAAMLAGCGFSVAQRVGSRRADLLHALAAFKRRSAIADVGVIYSTGHGVERDGEVYLIPADYPLSGGFGAASLGRRAVAVSRMVSAASARRQNLVFFAGCRRALID